MTHLFFILFLLLFFFLLAVSLDSIRIPEQQYMSEIQWSFANLALFLIKTKNLFIQL